MVESEYVALLIPRNLQKILDAQKSKNAEFDESVYVRCTWGVSLFVAALQYEGDEGSTYFASHYGR